ncbi:MAG: 3-phosphoshikimate 1-carboxyvinyltransferase [Ilumatobacter sp.]|uniref:3-phosphoshikimate 1-carboxyvinyltransferase n=1 Tax=Ilumatobacter sp. TaxID=1967498 RepID=UPI00262C8F6C|nr:3-phosphoshikimate 1-carboxyvinyltransferase [Ilumatobacter sp.]MDJ0771250.1 3-phosphoshikimate 1-carboxyvinyltransferase [Ilumatobacter sp.]
MSDVHRVRQLGEPVDAVVRVPGSKSIANRALICAALASGTSELSNIPDGDDTAAMLAGLRELGRDVHLHGEQVSVSGGPVDWPPSRLYAGLAGTTSRFLTALAALGSAPVVVDGAPPLRERPFGPLHDALTQIGVAVSPGASSGHLPATVQGPPSSGQVTIRGDVSSQYVTALMLIGPRLPGGLDLTLSSPLISRPYVELTAAVMAAFGRPDVGVGDALIRVAAGSYEAADLVIEPDASSASYPLAVAAVAGGSVTVVGLGAGSLQGDARFADLLADMGCHVERTSDSVRVVRGSEPLRGIDVDMADVSDLVPTLAVVAATASSPSRIRGVGFIRRKESDRLGDLAGELRRAGVGVSETADGLVIEPSTGRLVPARLATHHDHRLAMAFAVLGCLVDGIEVESPDVVGKSWPGFWTMLDGLR